MNGMSLTLKGTPQGLLLQPQSQTWEEFLKALEISLRDAHAFFQGGRVILDLKERELTEKELLALRQLLNTYDIELFAILGSDEQARHIARSYGIRTRLPGEKKSSDSADQGENALFIKRTIRSGQRRNFPGNITILGDVNAGAEVIAGDSIVVWGKVRGLLHAGAMGDEGAIICALDLQPAQLRIAGYINRAPDNHHRKFQPEVAEVHDGMIIVKPWMARG